MDNLEREREIKKEYNLLVILYAYMFSWNEKVRLLKIDFYSYKLFLILFSLMCGK